MAQFFFEYSLFSAKLLTVLGALLLVGIVAGFLLATRPRTRETIEIEKINDKIDALKEALESEILTKEEIKALRKERKKQERLDAKALKKRLKEGATAPPQRARLYTLKFTGDMHASEVENLRESITAILTTVKTTDEVMVILESAGGLVHNYGLAAAQLQRIKQKNIPLTVAVDLVAASGGYLMACVADKILAAPFAIVGSIGVLAQVPNFNRLLEKNNIDIEQHTAGKYKTTLTLFGKNTDKAREKFKQELEDTHILFKEFVQEHRPILEIEHLSTGEHWYGKQALELKLVDELITSDDYLLNKSADTDIFEISYAINTTLTDKVSHFLGAVTTQLINSVKNVVGSVSNIES